MNKTEAATPIGPKAAGSKYFEAASAANNTPGTIIISGWIPVLVDGEVVVSARANENDYYNLLQK